MSYMAPGFSFFFTTAVIAAAAGIHVPVTYVIAGLGVLCAGATFAEFSRRSPSAGSLQVFIGRGFGRKASVAGGLVLTVGYLCLQAGVLVLFGGWTARLLESAFGLAVPWAVLSVVGGAALTVLMVRGVELSLKVTWVFFLVEFVLIVLVCGAVLLGGGDSGHTAAPFNVFDLQGPGLSGIAVGMIFAAFSFVGFEGSVSFAEETPDPRKALPVAVLGGVAAMVLLYVFGTYAAVIGFGTDNVDALGADPEPIATLAGMFAGPLKPVLEFAVLTSIVANLMAAGNANARILFNLGREQAVPAALGAVHPRYRTPHVAIVTFMLITFVPGLLAAPYWNYLDAFGAIAGFGALLALLIYMVATLALPFYARREGLAVRVGTHLLIPVVGAGVWLLPIWGSLEPGQDFPFNTFPVLAALVIGAATLYAWMRTPASLTAPVVSEPLPDGVVGTDPA